MKLVTDNAFTKAWEISCPTCRIDQPHSMLWFKKQCHECEIKVVADKKYTEEDIREAIDMARMLSHVSCLGDGEHRLKHSNTEEDIINSLNKQD